MNWLFIGLTLTASGLVFACAVKTIMPWKDLNLDITILSGLIVLTTFCNFISLFSPINYIINIIITSLLLIFLLFYKNAILDVIKKWQNNITRWHWMTIFAAVFITLIALLKTTGPSLMEDEIGYHLPLIRWIENYPIIRGIANIEDRMGFNPAIYMTNAYFGMTWFFPGGLYDVNSFLYLVFSYSFLNGMNRFIQRNFQYLFSDLIKISALLFIFRNYLTTMDADFIYIYGTIYLLLLLLRKIENTSLCEFDYNTLLFILLFSFIITNKFIIILLAPLLIGLFYKLFKAGKQSFITYSILFALPVIGSWLLRNYHISGYLVYPLYFIDLFNPSWKVPDSLIQGQYNYVIEFAKTEVVQAFNTYSNHDYPWKIWFPMWLQNTWQLLIGKIIIIITPLNLLLTGVYFLSFSKKWKKENRYYLLLLLILIVATIFWLIQAPAVRFAWGWLLPFMVLSFALLLKKLLLKYYIFLIVSLIIMLFTSLIRGVVDSVQDFPGIMQHLVKPVSIEKELIYKELYWDNVKVKVARDNFCRGAIPPCVPRDYHPLLQLNGNDLKSGFKIK